MIIDTPFTARRRGFNLIEVALVLGVIGLAASGIWVVSATINENLKVNDFTAGILTACDRASISFPAKMSPPSYIGIWPPVLVAAKIFPQSWGFKNGNIEPPLGVMGTTYWMDSNQGAEYTGEVRINITSITESQCLKILPKLSI